VRLNLLTIKAINLGNADQYPEKLSNMQDVAVAFILQSANNPSSAHKEFLNKLPPPALRRENKIIAFRKKTESTWKIIGGAFLLFTRSQYRLDKK
jgi:hypothetical protein